MTVDLIQKTSFVDPSSILVAAKEEIAKQYPLPVYTPPSTLNLINLTIRKIQIKDALATTTLFLFLGVVSIGFIALTSQSIEAVFFTAPLTFATASLTVNLVAEVAILFFSTTLLVGAIGLTGILIGIVSFKFEKTYRQLKLKHESDFKDKVATIEKARSIALGKSYNKTIQEQISLSMNVKNQAFAQIQATIFDNELAVTNLSILDDLQNSVLPALIQNAKSVIDPYNTFAERELKTTEDYRHLAAILPFDLSPLDLFTDPLLTKIQDISQTLQKIVEESNLETLEDRLDQEGCFCPLSGIIPPIPVLGLTDNILNLSSVNNFWNTSYDQKDRDNQETELGYRDPILIGQALDYSQLVLDLSKLETTIEIIREELKKA